ncbi:MAG: hypothetical protein AB8G11_09990, partial [Saprospiraceae bacterium]
MSQNHFGGGDNIDGNKITNNNTNDTFTGLASLINGKNAGDALLAVLFVVGLFILFFFAPGI